MIIRDGTVNYDFEGGAGGQGVQGLTLYLGAIESRDEFLITINGGTIDLETLINSGQAEIIDAGQLPGASQAGGFADVDGSELSLAGSDPFGNVAISFNIPIKSLSVFSPGNDNVDAIDLFINSEAVGIVDNSGIVNGEAFGETMGLGYNDGNAPTNQGGDVITNGDDTIFGNGGGDTIDGAGGDDLIYGDGGNFGAAGDPGAPGDDVIDGGAGQDTVYGGAGSDTIDGGEGNDVLYGGIDPNAGGTVVARESFEWDKLPDPNSGGSIDDGDPVENVTQDTGIVNVGFRVVSESSHQIDHEFSDEDQNVDGIDDGSETIDNDSGLKSDLSHVNHGSTSYEMTFDQEVENVDFRVNDADGSAKVTIKAYDAAGNEVPVTFLLGDGLQSVTDGFETKNAGEYGEEDDPDFSSLVQIAGPVARIEISHSEGNYNSAVWFTDVYFDVVEEYDPGEDAADSIDGGLGDDEIYGEAGDDRIFGNHGDDTIFGGEGNDNLGGADLGDDTFFGGDGNDMVEASYGDDTLYGGSGDDDLWASADDDTVFGGTGNDSSYGGHGKDIVYGEEGNDTLSGGSDDDSIFGGTGNDVIDGDRLYKDDNGAAGDDYIEGGEGDDIIDAGAGADTVFGGDGRDTILGGNIGDIVDGGTGGDDFDILDLTGAGPFSVVDETLDPDGDSTSGTINFLDPNGNVIGTMEFAEIERIIGDRVMPDGTVDGTDGNDVMDVGFVDFQGDTIDGDDGDDDIILGYGGNDNISAGDGDDTVFGGTGNDTIGGGDGDDTIYGDEGDDRLFGGEGADSIFGGEGNDTLSGNRGGDYLDGGEGNDTINGDIAGDTLVGGDGNDLLRGENGDDTINGGDGNDTADGGDGNDIIDTSGPISLNPNDPTGKPDQDYPGLYVADDDPTNDLDTVFGGGGNDTITTGDDDDSIDGGIGNDVIDAGFDDDTIDGGDGNDFIIGGEGNDTIEGGAGDDTIFGGLEDAFDVLNIPDDAGDLRPDNGDDVIYGGSGNDVIDGKDDSDTIFGGADDDSITGGIDDDTVYGDDGNDTFTDDHGADEYYGGEGNDSFDYTGSSVDFADGDLVDGGTEGEDQDTLDLTGLGRFRKVNESVDADGDSTSGTIEFLDDNDNVTGTLTYSEIENIIPCFTPGTMIATMQGERKVEDLMVGDRIITRDNGAQEIRWIGAKPLSGMQLASNPHLQPILIQKGALGNGLPERDMLVSPQHRVLVHNADVGLMFNEPEVLVAAKHLIDPTKGIVRVQASQATYLHMMFDHHEVVLSDGAWTESFQPGDQAMAGIGKEQREEIFQLFPELVGSAGREAFAAARLSLKKHEAEMLKK